MDTTLKIALYGAIVSTVSLLIHYFNYRRDRADLKISVKGNIGVYPKNTIYGDKTYISVDIANRGRRPVTITKCAFKTPKGTTKGWMVSGDSIRNPVELLEGKSKTYLFDEAEIKKYNLIDKDLVACAVDATGQYYWADNLLMRWIKLRRCKRKIAKAKG